MIPLRIFVGYDPRETVAFHVLSNSIMRHASAPVAIIPLIQSQLRSSGIYTRERGPTESTEFSLTRFLVPYLSGYKGVSLFLDCDMLCRADLTELEYEAAAAKIGIGPRYGVWVSKHDYTPKPGVKFLGNIQTAYPRKNWSSVMLFDNEECKMLTPEYVNSATGLELHRFQWIDDEKIGGLPLEWNWLVGEYDSIEDPKIVHWTNGGPWFPETNNCEYADLWRSELSSMNIIHVSQESLALSHGRS